VKVSRDKSGQKTGFGTWECEGVRHKLPSSENVFKHEVSIEIEFIQETAWGDRIYRFM